MNPVPPPFIERKLIPMDAVRLEGVSYEVRRVKGRLFHLKVLLISQGTGLYVDDKIAINGFRYKCISSDEREAVLKYLGPYNKPDIEEPSMDLLSLVFGKAAPAELPEIPPVPADLQGRTNTDKLELIIIGLLGLLLAFEKAAEDGLTIGDVFPMIGPARIAAGALKAWPEAKDEISDCTAAEAERLVKIIVGRLEGLPSGAASLIAIKLVQLTPGLVDALHTIAEIRAQGGVIPKAEPV